MTATSKTIDNDTYEYASLNRRIIAIGIDFIIVSIVLYPISNLLLALLPKDTQVSMKNLTNGSVVELSNVNNQILEVVSNWPYIIAQLAILLLAGLYFIYVWVKIRSSIGGYIMKCNVVDASDYRAITYGQAVKRIIGSIMNVFTFGIGLFAADFTKRKQGLHDKIARTVVIIRK